MATITTTGVIDDGAGNPVKGFVEFAQSAQYAADGGLVTTAIGRVAVRSGQWVYTDPVIPTTPVGQFVRVRQYFNGGYGGGYTEWWTHIDAVSAIEFADLPVDVPPPSQDISALSASYLPKFMPATNLIQNGDFATGAAKWNLYGGSPVVEASTYKITGDGTLGMVGLSQMQGHRYVGSAGHHIYVRSRVRVTNPNASSIRVSVIANSVETYSPATVVTSPAQDLWYDVSGIIYLPESADGQQVATYVRAAYANAATASGKTTEVFTVFSLDLTEIYGVGNEPTAAEVDALLVKHAPHSRFNGTDATFQPTLAANLEANFARRRAHSVTAGPHVVLRFDDGFENNVTVAAPILARYGFVGTLFVCTHPTAWIGTLQAAGQIMTAAQLRTLNDDYGWEIASHTREHTDGIATALGTWVSDISQSIQDLLDMGLPYPESFAYPNGSRTASTDRYVYRLFSKCGITGGPERSPTRFNDPTFFTGWATIDSSDATVKARHVERAKAYVRAAFQQGRIPVLGFHGITPGSDTPSHSFHLDETTFAELMQWLWDEGYPVGTMRDTPPHNLLADPGFELSPVNTPAQGSHPWTLNTTTASWDRVEASSFGSGRWQMKVDSGGALIPGGSAKILEQRIPVTPGAHKLYLDINVPTWVAGGIRVNVYYHDILGADFGSPSFDVVTVTAATVGAVSRPGTFTVPAGAASARVAIQTNSATGFNGVAYVGHVAAFPATTYDPLA